MGIFWNWRVASPPMMEMQTPWSMSMQLGGEVENFTDGYSTVILLVYTLLVSLLKIKNAISDDSNERWSCYCFKLQGVGIIIISTITSSSLLIFSLWNCDNKIINYSNKLSNLILRPQDCLRFISATTGLISGTPTLVGTYTTNHNCN